VKPEHNAELSAQLSAQLEAMKQVPGAAIEAAQIKLMQRLQQAKPLPTQRGNKPLARHRTWLSASAIAFGLIVAVWLSPLMFSKNLAFAQVQAHLLNFSSLVMHITTTINSVTKQRTTVQINADGQVRTDVDEQLSTIVDPKARQVMILLHAQKIAVIERISADQPTQPSAPADQMGAEFLEQLRTYKGLATRLPNRKTVDGVSAQGFALALSGQDCVLWVDSRGLPLEMEISNSVHVRTEFRFEFDRPLAPRLFSRDPPAGYRLQAADSD
jgi:outer membrane lipoprotein-sorting protein